MFKLLFSALETLFIFIFFVCVRLGKFLGIRSRFSKVGRVLE